MKYKTAVVIVSLLLAATAAIGGAHYFSPHRQGEKKGKIVTTFYPVYIAAKNITDGIDGIELVNLTDSTVGCVHDFQLRPQDMVTLENASLLLVNGGGMEPFLEDVAAQYPSLIMADSSQGISLLPGAEASIGLEGSAHEEHDHENASYNPHLWLSPSRYLQQLENICSAISAQFPQYAAQLRQNTDAYKRQVQALQGEMEAALGQLPRREVILFHDSFAYFADDFNLSIAGMIPIEADSALSAGDVARIIDTIQKSGVGILFAEEQYSTALAEAIASETSAAVYTLDTCVTGPAEKSAYLDAMQKNLDVLRRALA